MRMATLALLGLSLGGCGAEDPPTSCGDPSMSIITLQGKTDDAEHEIRTCVDIHAASRRDATATSPGRDDNFATSRASVIPWTSLTFGEAVQACGRAGKFLCNADELRAIAPIKSNAFGSVQFDESAISALSPTSQQEGVASRFDRLNPVDMIISGKTGQPPFPEAVGSVAFWTYSPERLDAYQDPDVPLLLGRLVADSAIGGVLDTTPVTEGSFTHPLVGFRCCINARMRSAFTEVNPNPALVREEAPNVPIQE